MTQAAKIKKARQRGPRREPKSRLPRGLLALAGVGVAGLLVAGFLLWDSSASETVETFTGVPSTDPGPIHVHGLGIDPADGSLYVATHTGLFRLGRDAPKAVRVTDRHQDTMGFSIVGPGRFLGSGHPDARDQSLPPLLGLIESTDAGRSWQSISLLGEADFHVLRSADERVYGYDASNDRLLASADAGRTWEELDKPAPIVDLAASPRNPRRLVATAIDGLNGGMHASRDGGRSWARLNDAVGLLAWPAEDTLYLVNDEGQMLVSSDGGRRLRPRGMIGGRPAALLAVTEDELYVALHGGTIKHSTDGGVSWAVRSTA